MQQPYDFSFSKLFRFSEADDSETRESCFWRTAIDRLAEKKWSWEQFLQGAPLIEHPSLKFCSSKEENTLLHLAVLSNRPDLVQSLHITDPQLKMKRNLLGLTPFELSQFLNRREIAKILSPSFSPPSFSSQPNLSLPENDSSFEQLEFLAQPIFESEALFEEVLLRAQKAKAEDHIPSERIWMGVYFDNEIQRGLHFPLAIRFIDREIGYGVFSKQRIPPCAFVGEYTGVIQERNPKLLKHQFYSVRYTVWGTEKKKFILNAENKGNFTRFINHSDQPNLCLQTIYWKGIPRMIFVALKEIPPETQLTFDYGALFWKQCKKAPKPL